MSVNFLLRIILWLLPAVCGTAWWFTMFDFLEFKFVTTPITYYPLILPFLGYLDSKLSKKISALPEEYQRQNTIFHCLKFTAWQFLIVVSTAIILIGSCLSQVHFGH